jgi:hypothetical protein
MTSFSQTLNNTQNISSRVASFIFMTTRASSFFVLFHIYIPSWISYCRISFGMDFEIIHTVLTSSKWNLLHTCCSWCCCMVPDLKVSCVIALLVRLFHLLDDGRWLRLERDSNRMAPGNIEIFQLTACYLLNCWRNEDVTPFNCIHNPPATDNSNWTLLS